MRFRNYKNKFNNSNRIYSEDDILQMKLASIFNNENDILAQNHEIGIPTLKELQDSQNTQWVEPFVDDNGLDDGGYWQSIMDEDETPQIKAIESIAPKNNVPAVLQAKNQEQPYLLQGGIEYNKPEPIQDSNDSDKEIYSKYKGLSPKAAFQKEITKNLPKLHTSEKEYYEHALRRADGEEPTDFMKEQNDFRKIDEISDPELKQMYIEKAAKMYGLDVNAPDTYDAVKNTDVVIPKIDSKLYSQIKNSKDFQKWVAKNYENIKNNTNENTSIEFSPSLYNYNQNDLFGSIHNTDLKNSKINEDGSFTTNVLDAYDFENWEKRHYKDSKSFWDPFKIFAHNRIRPANNRAKEQQDLDQLQRYLLSTQINLNKEELEEILKKYRHR